MTVLDKSVSEKKAAIFRERAVKLAAVAEEEAGEWVEIVEFKLGGERYGLEFSFVEEVFPSFEITPLPCAPSFLSGVVNLRGRIVPVVDLKVVFKIPGCGANRPGVVVMTDGKGEMGFLADEITGIARISREELHPPLSPAGGASAYAAGISGEDLTVLDGEKILEDRGLIVDEEP